MLIRSVGVHDVNIRVPVPIADEDDAVAVGGIVGIGIASGRVGQTVARAARDTSRARKGATSFTVVRAAIR
jgi:hypothetical protein